MRNNSPIRTAIFSIKKAVLPCLSGKEAHEAIVRDLRNDGPSMIARFGAVEIKGLLYATSPPPINLCLRNYAYSHMGSNAGFFPVDKKHLKRYAERMRADMKELTTLASWRPEEIYFKKSLKNVPKVALGDLGPVVADYSWSQYLEGKRVLVVHPFAETIERQYEKRALLWENPHILPEFASLQTVKAVQSIAGNNPDGFADWFEALESMEQEIATKDFDIALLGCGAYGFCLAAAIKRMGKKAVHIGGSLQLYFGIKGKRWDNRGFYNEHWVSPGDAERPANLSKVEGGCYW